MSCGQSTDEYATEKAVETYRDWGLVEGEGREEVVTLRDAATELRQICNQHREHNLILKMDCEGEEYRILEALAAAELLEKFDFVMLEWHYKGSETLLAYLRNSGFSYWQYDKSEKMGLIYAWNMNQSV